ncbi:hypothetical protein [Amycolatopsis coloradensis]|nr:hypothetical protein [Amycolatopsis coloradensis]
MGILVGALLEGSFRGRLADPGDFGPFRVVAAVSQAYRRVTVG